MVVKETDIVEKLLQEKGVFQKRLAAALIILGLANGTQLLIGVFLTFTPEFTCRLPDNLENLQQGIKTHQNFTTDSLHNITLKTCSVVYHNNVTNLSVIEMTNTENSTYEQKCELGWEYMEEDGVFSTAMEFDWVCERAWMSPFLFSIQMVGLMIGSIFGGMIPDKFGRKWPFIITAVLKHVLIFCCGLAPNSLSLFILMGISFTTFILQALGGVIIANELLHDSLRDIVTMAQMGMYSFGYMLLPGIAYLIPNWRWMTCCISVIGFLTLPALYCIVESPRWLLLRGRKEEAFEILHMIADVNKLNSDKRCEIFDSKEDKIMEDNNNNNTFSDGSSIQDEKEFLKKEELINDDKTLEAGLIRNNKLGYFDIFKIPALRYRILIFGYAWTSISSSYYGSSFNTNELGGNRYMNCFYSGLVDIPGTVLTVYLLRKVGGRICFTIFMVLSSVFIICTAIFDPISEIGVLVCAMIAKMLLAGAFCVLYAFTGEQFPTLIRNQAYGSCSFVSRISTIFTPYLLYLGRIYTMRIPYFTMAGMNLLSGVVFLLLPETKGMSIPDTIEDIFEQEKKKRRYHLKCKRSLRRSEEFQSIPKLELDETRR